MKRLFVAIDIPEKIKKSILEMELEENLFRRVPFDQLHITLFFLGNTHKKHVPEIISLLSDIFIEPFTIYTDKPGAFPSVKNPRVIWIGLNNTEKLVGLHHKVAEKIGCYHSDMPDKKYIPHITIARTRKKISNPAIYFDKLCFKGGNKICVDSFHLYESCLSSDGATHKVLKSFYLN
ncbi:MAG: RNA 2',3'-cyclic phosphodiesterase [Balneolaceae bacterium]